MPSKKTLVALLGQVLFAVRINVHLFKKLKKTLMNSEDRRCVLLFDEIDTKKNLQYDVATDRVLTFEEIQNGVVSSKLANKALVFMLQGLRSKKWKQPVAYYFNNNGCSADYLLQCLRAVLSAASEIAALDVIATIYDMGTSNAKIMILK